MSTPPAAMRALFLRPVVTRAWDADTTRLRLQPLADRGADTVVIKSGAITGDQLQVAADLGLRVVLALTCYSDHDRAVKVSDRLRPVGRDGRRIGPVEWYEGIVPTDAGYNAELLERAGYAAGTPGIDGVLLDFLRWPGHWEHDLRPGQQARASSYDPASLTAFAAWGGAAGADADEWTAFKCDVITARARELAAVVREAGRWAGCFVVPADGTRRRRDYGQDTAALGDVVDLLVSMTFHGITGHPPSWVGDVVSDVRSTTPCPVLPMVQVTADPAVAGAGDWGTRITGDDVASAADAARDAGGSGLCLFPGEAGGASPPWPASPACTPAIPTESRPS